MIKSNRNIENGIKAQKLKDQEDVRLTFGEPVTDENTFTFEDQKDYPPSPERKLIVKQIAPPSNADELEYDKENHDICTSSMNMFEHYQDSSSVEEEPRDLSESLINLDTYTGKVELYGDKMVGEETAEFEHKDYIIIKPQFDERRMIALPKNNEPVNISDMLSRSFIFDNDESMASDGYDRLNMSVNIIDAGNFRSVCNSRSGNLNLRNSQINITNYSPTKMHESYSRSSLYEHRQNEILLQMEQEHDKIKKHRQNKLASIL